VKLRFNWNAAIAIDPFDPQILYYGSQFLHKSRDKGQTWEIISPDLTTNNPEKQKQAESGGLTKDVTFAENHCTIITIAPSPVQKGVIWVGTDDGQVQLTRDGGNSWQNLSSKFTVKKRSLVPVGTWVPHIEASHHEAGTAYVVFDDHRRANWTPYVFMTKDFGQSWQSLATSTIDGFAHVIKEDPVQKNLLFLGTEFGLYVSFDGGKKWMKWTSGLPTVPVRDMVISLELMGVLFIYWMIFSLYVNFQRRSGQKSSIFSQWLMLINSEPVSTAPDILLLEIWNSRVKIVLMEHLSPIHWVNWRLTSRFCGQSSTQDKRT